MEAVNICLAVGAIYTYKISGLATFYLIPASVLDSFRRH
jgi:hypothetical protein